VKIKDNMGKVTTGKVAQANGIIEITTADGKMINVAQIRMDQMDETETVVFAIGPDGAPAPSDLKEAMDGNGNRAVLLNKCKENKGALCDFSPVFSGLGRRLRGVLAQPMSFLAAIGSAAADACNAFKSIRDCVATHSTGLTCGWCIGAAVKYNDSSMPKDQHCAEPSQPGQPATFVCPRTWCQGEQCAHGYDCDYTTGTATCVKSETAPKYANLTECQTGAGSLPACKAQDLFKCNTATKTCDKAKTGGEPKANCEAHCNVPHAKCDHIKQTCTPCDPGKDKNCTDTKGACDTKCKKNFNTCDHATGKCNKCDPGSTPDCTVDGCSDLACMNDVDKYLCDQTNPEHPVCQRSYAANATILTTCNKNCKIQPHKKYMCDWASYTCKENPAGDTKANCVDGCHAPAYAKCNTTTGKCDKCTTPGVSGCTTKAVCTAPHKCVVPPPSGPTGTYRAIEISKSFMRGEWDFTFRAKGVVDMAYHATTDDSKQRYSLLVMGSKALTVDGTPGASIGFTFTKVPSTSTGAAHKEVTLAGFSPQVGDKMAGIYVTQDGSQTPPQKVAFMYMALSLPSPTSTAVTSFDEGMAKLEFNMVACKDTGVCDFTSAMVPEN
jgi:hypothetical protein